MVIATKAAMYRLLYSGRFGNYPLAWESIEALQASGYSGLVSVRSREVANPVRMYGVKAAEVVAKVASLPPAQRDSGLIFSEFMPHETDGCIQGEWDGFNLQYTFAKAPMRLAMEQQSLHAHGPAARMILKRSLDTGDYEWLNDLSADFPSHVVEFSGFRCRVGTHRRRMVVWEVRYY